ncbi:AAA family ATPase [Olsenella sp. HMSC062G07]|uniref:cytidylate kinase-like family protein n=1 Tax=Olsenella sp. HMSC062G07 TaxID=1739330 RepID=UPI0009F5CC1A|nr:cytidylate kinase-like family protein [Olsenella sp. HMSC062G07]
MSPITLAARHSTDLTGVCGGSDPIVVSIARDYGAEGHEVGKLLADRLSIPLYDNELLVRSARRMGVNVDQAALAERAQDVPLALLPGAIDQRTESDRLFEAMRQVILDLGATTSCIIEGRLSDYILRDNPNLIAVLVTAPLECRVKIVADKRGLSPHEALTLVRRQQRRRERFYTRYSAGRWDMYADKDLVVDRSVFGRQGCCDIIAAAYEYKRSLIGR